MGSGLQTLLIIVAAFLASGCTSLRDWSSPEDAASITLKNFLTSDDNAYRLLSPQDQGEVGHRFHRFVVADTNSDGRPDLIAVLVKPGTPNTFSVVAFHGGSRGFADIPFWIITDVKEAILGVEVGPNAVMPIRCYPCDANPVFHWTGDDYDFFLKGDDILLLPGARILAEANPASRVLFEAPQSTKGEATTGTAKILKYGPCLPSRAGAYKRWYFVRLTNEGKSTEGFISRDFLKVVGPRGAQKIDRLTSRLSGPA